MPKVALERHEVLMYTAQPRPARKATTTTTGTGGAAGAAGSSSDVAAQNPEEAQRHRDAVREYRERCHGNDPWVCTEVLLYLLDGDKVVERYALWFFPSVRERFLISTNADRGVDEFYILVRLEGKNALDKLSLGVCKSTHDGISTFGPASSTPGAPWDPDPTEGYVVRIVSIEQDGEPLQHPEDASPYLQNARHIREVIRKHAGKCDAVSASETLHHKFGVLRTEAYVKAKETLDADECGSDEWEAALHALDDPSAYPWALANRVAALGLMDALADAETRLLPQGKRHIVEDIWLVDESLPLASSEFAAASRWAVQKSIKGTGSIPRAKMWEPLVIFNHDEVSSDFRLMRMA